MNLTMEDKSMDYTASEVVQYVCENDVKFVRLAFCDLFGTLKNISILADELPRAFEKGVAFDASAIKGFLSIDNSDLFLFPDPTTLAILPWRPHQGGVVRMYCNIKYPDGTDFEGDGRNILRRAVARVQEKGYDCKIGTDCEFYLFQADERGCPSKVTQDEAGYLDVAPMDKGENVRREICLTLKEMGISPERSLHEQGPGQNEIDFKHSGVMAAADNFISFRTAVRMVAASNGLFASFMPKPLENENGSGLHINISLFHNGLNIFKNDLYPHSMVAKSFIAGILVHVAELSVFFNSIPNSYQRLGCPQSPKYIAWSRQRHCQLVRIPGGDDETSQMELRSPDPFINPYIAFALLLDAGMDGVDRMLELPQEADMNLFWKTAEHDKKMAALPKDLADAVKLARQSELIERCLPESTVKTYLDEKQKEWENYMVADDKMSYENAHYFFLQ